MSFYSLSFGVALVVSITSVSESCALSLTLITVIGDWTSEVGLNFELT